jgi:hypothetical protein
VAFDSNAFDVDAFDELAFLFDGATPAPSPTTQTPAGRPRKRYYVEIDGQQFFVRDAEEARSLLEQARALAEKQAEAQGEKAVRKLSAKRKVPKVKIDPPVVSASPEIKQDLSPLIADINRLYRQAAVNAEIRLHMEMLARKQAEDEEEEDLLLLLL